jgi:hypothetical protein
MSEEGREVELELEAFLEEEIEEAIEETEETTAEEYWEEIRGDIERKVDRFIESGRELSRDWLMGWAAHMDHNVARVMEMWLETYFEKQGYSEEYARDASYLLAAVVARDTPARDRYSYDATAIAPKLVEVVKNDPRPLTPVWGDIRRISNYYISLDPYELGAVLNTVDIAKSTRVDPKVVAREIAEMVPRLSPRSLYFNLYYIGKGLGDDYMVAVARELSRMRRG